MLVSRSLLASNRVTPTSEIPGRWFTCVLPKHMAHAPRVARRAATRSSSTIRSPGTARGLLSSRLRSIGNHSVDPARRTSGGTAGIPADFGKGHTSSYATGLEAEMNSDESFRRVHPDIVSLFSRSLDCGSPIRVRDFDNIHSPLNSNRAIKRTRSTHTGWSSGRPRGPSAKRAPVQTKECLNSSVCSASGSSRPIENMFNLLLSVGQRVMCGRINMVASRLTRNIYSIVGRNRCSVREFMAKLVKMCPDALRRYRIPFQPLTRRTCW
jgi:hypothetical protein